MAASPSDVTIAELLDRLGEAADFSEACSLVLDRVVAQGGFDRAVAVVQTGSTLRGIGWGIPDEAIRALLSTACEADSPLADLLGRQEPGLISTPESVPFLDFSACAVLPFLRGGQGVILLETDRLEERALLVQSIFRRCGAALTRALELDRLRARVERLDRQRDLLTGILDALADPVLLTDEDNDILLTNHRAESLFSAGPGDSDGRRRAVQVNNLLFSSFLTRAVISAGQAGGRELNLVDPSDGSDLLFEALSVPLPSTIKPEGTVITILRDITDLRRAVVELEVQFNRSRVAEHRARRERDQLNVILENVGDPILVTDDQAKIILVNREAERLFDAPASEDAGVRRRRIVQANDTRFTSLISNFRLQESQRRIEVLELTDPDTGDDFPAEIVSSKIQDSRGETTAIVSVVHDLTQVVENQRLARELRQLNEELEGRIARATEELEAHNRRLEWQSRELEKASRLKSEFLANMSHELRTPLNVLLGYTALLRDGIYGPLNQDQTQALGKVRTSSEHLLDLINEILDLSKIEAGKMPVNVERVNLEEMVAEISEAIEPLLSRKPLAFSAEIAPGLPVLRTDRTKVKQILFNLISNAVKFTEQGSIRLQVNGAEVGGGVRMSVSDTGIGIRTEDLETIFEDFRQLDQTTTKVRGGTGLGLSITRKLVTLLGGTISVESRLGHGSVFTVILPPVLSRPAANHAAHRDPLDAVEQ